MNTKRMKNSLVVLLVLAIMLSAAGTVFAAYPERSVKIIIPWSVGGMTDVLTRPIAKWLEDYFGVPFVVENKPGGSGIIGSLLIEHAEADGYVFGTTSMSTVSAQYVSPVYPKMENVEPIAQAITIPATVTVNADSPWKTLDEYISYAKANPGKIKNSNSGIGASAHISAIVFEDKAGIELSHIPYVAYAEAVVALLGGHVDSTNVPLPDVAPHIESGKLRMLAIASNERHPDFPDVPTLKELGIDVVMGNYSGFVAPKGVTKEQIKVLEEGIGKALQDPEIRNFLIGAGFQPVYLNAEEFAKKIKDTEDSLNYLVNELGIEFVDD
jgi:tripartite-type tricarboxylate transporter receptor subunit TctC